MSHYHKMLVELLEMSPFIHVAINEIMERIRKSNMNIHETVEYERINDETRKVLAEIFYEFFIGCGDVMEFARRLAIFLIEHNVVEVLKERFMLMAINPKMY